MIPLCRRLATARVAPPPSAVMVEERPFRAAKRNNKKYSSALPKAQRAAKAKREKGEGQIPGIPPFASQRSGAPTQYREGQQGKAWRTRRVIIYDHFVRSTKIEQLLHNKDGAAGFVL